MSSNSYGGGGPLAVGVASALMGLATILLALRAYTSFQIIRRPTWDLLWIFTAYVSLFRPRGMEHCLSDVDTATGSPRANISDPNHSLWHRKPLGRGGSNSSRAGLSVQLDVQHLHHPLHRIRETCHSRYLAPYPRANQQNQALDPVFRWCVNNASEYQPKHHCLVSVQSEG